MKTLQPNSSKWRNNVDNIGQLIITGIKGLALTEEEKTFAYRKNLCETNTNSAFKTNQCGRKEPVLHYFYGNIETL